MKNEPTTIVQTKLEYNLLTLAYVFLIFHVFGYDKIVIFMFANDTVSYNASALFKFIRKYH